MAAESTLASFGPLVRETANAFRTDLSYAIAVAKQAGSIRARQQAKLQRESSEAVQALATDV